MSARLTLALALGLLVQPGCVSAKRQARASARVELGAAYLNENSPEAAIGALREAVKLDPYNWAAWEKLGLAYMAKGALEESDDAFQRALRLEPLNAQVLNNYGLMLLAAGRRTDAIASFEEATKDLAYRRPALTLTNLGYALYLDGQNDLAIKRLDEALKHSPNLCQARFNRGLAWQAKAENVRALTDFEGVIQRCGESVPGAYFQAARLLVVQGDREAARAYLRTVERLAPDSELARASQDLMVHEGL